MKPTDPKKKPTSIYDDPVLKYHPARHLVQDLESARRSGGGNVASEAFWTAFQRFHGVTEKVTPPRNADVGIMTDEIRRGRTDKQIANDWFIEHGYPDLVDFCKNTKMDDEFKGVDWDWQAKNPEVGEVSVTSNLPEDEQEFLASIKAADEKNPLNVSAASAPAGFKTAWDVLNIKIH